MGTTSMGTPFNHCNVRDQSFSFTKLLFPCSLPSNLFVHCLPGYQVWMISCDSLINEKVQCVSNMYIQGKRRRAAVLTCNDDKLLCCFSYYLFLELACTATLDSIQALVDFIGTIDSNVDLWVSVWGSRCQQKQGLCMSLHSDRLTVPRFP